MKRGLKGLFLLLFLLHLSLYVFAAEEIDKSRATFSIRVGDSQAIRGVNFTLLRTSVDYGKVVMCINNKKVIVSDSGTFGNAIVTVDDIFSSAANLDIEINCNTKCRCVDHPECVNDACFSSTSSPFCTFDDECDDGNPSTSDLCINRVCEHRPLQLQSCTLNSQCDDRNPCTTDGCNSLLKKCIHVEIEGCTIQVPPPQQQPSQSSSKVSVQQVSTFVLFGIVLILLIAVVVKRSIR